MLLVCPNCATSYMIDPASLGAAGRTVRCTRCKTSWFAGGPEAPAEAVAVAETASAEAQGQPPRRARTETPPEPPAPAPAAAAAAPQAAEPAAPPAPPAVAAEDPRMAEPEAAPAVAAVAEAPLREPQEEQVVEAPPVTVTDAPPLAPAAAHETQSDPADAEAEVAATFDARRRAIQARRKKSRRSSRWSAVILVLVAFNVAAIGARNEVVRYLPQTASLFAAIGLPVNLRNLKFENVKLSTEDAGGIPMLTVQGAIVSDAGKAVAVPRLRFAVRNATGQEVYTWTMAPPTSVLEAGARAEFRSQIPVPQVDAADVLVRFLTPQDARSK